MENSYGTISPGDNTAGFMGGYEALAQELVVSERGHRLAEADYLTEEIYDYARNRGRPVATRAQRTALLREYRMRR